MKKYNCLILVLLLLFLTQIVYSEFNPIDPEKKMEQVKEMIEKEQKKIRNEELESLKKNNPQEYEKRKKFYERQEQITQIIDSFQKGRITLDAAQRSLYPLVKENMQNYILNLDTEIQRLEKRLDSLKKTKTNPDMVIKKRINQMLGKEEIEQPVF